MIRPNIRCTVSKDNGFNVHGQAQYGEPINAKCSVVRYKAINQKTSVRTDSSASRGRADEDVYDAVLLFSPKTNINKNDVVEIFGEKLKVNNVERRFSALGVLDHLEVSLNRWA